VVDGIHVVLTDGHTPGHQSLVVDLPSGRFVLTGDCAYEYKQVSRGVPPPVTTDDVAAVRSLARIRAFEQRDHATVIVSHDMEAWESLRQAPTYA
jgi:glyoxylase-like metal-dependent hydrolase (beta-lactamase superfamily II)